MTKTILAVSGCLAVATSAYGSVLFDTFGPGDTYNAGIAFMLTGQYQADIYSAYIGFPLTTQALGAPFGLNGTPGEGFLITSIDMPLIRPTGTINLGGRVYNFPAASIGTVSINEDNGNKPGAPIYSIVNPPGSEISGTTDAVILSFVLLSPVVLQAGSTYWLTVIPEYYTVSGWFENDQGYGSGYVASTDHGGNWDYSPGEPPAFRVNGFSVNRTPTPDGGFAAGFLGIGLVGLGWLRRRG